MFSAIAFAITAAQSNVTIEIPLMRMYNAAPILSKAFGQKVEIATPLLNDTICARISNVPPKEAMEKIAETMNVTWEQKPGYLMLVQSPDQKLAERRYSETAAMEQAAKALGKTRDQVAKFKPFTTLEAVTLKRELEQLSQTKVKQDDEFDDGFWRRQNQVDEKGPISRFLRRIATRITPAMLAVATKDRPRVVYATTPTATQIQLPFRVDDFLGQLQEEQNTWADTAKGKEFEGPEAEGGGRYGLGTTAAHTSPLELAGVKVILAISLEESANTYTGIVKLITGKGELTAESSIPFMGFDYEEYMARLDEQKKKPKREFTFTGFAKTFYELFKDAKPVIARKLPDEVRKRYLRPEEHEPNEELSYQYLSQLYENKNFVVHNFGEIFPEMIRANADLDQLTGSMARIAKSDTWYTLSPLDRLQARKNQLDPKTLGPLVRKAEKSDCDSIEDQADFAIKLPRDSQLEWKYRQRIEILRPYQLPVYNDKNGLRIWATLNPNQRLALKNKAKIKLGELDQRTQAELYWSIFNESWNWFQVDYEAFQTKEGYMTDGYEEFQQKAYGIWREPTEASPNGLTAGQIMKGSDETSQMVLAGADEKSRYASPRVIDLTQAGQTAFMKKNPKKYPWANSEWERYNENELRIISQRTISISVEVRPKLLKDYHLTEMHVLDPKVYTLETLPAELKKKFDEGYKQAQENDKHYPENGFQRGNVPPPPPI